MIIIKKNENKMAEDGLVDCDDDISICPRLRVVLAKDD